MNIFIKFCNFTYLRIQLIATATVLGISWNKPCDSPLFLFLCVYFIQLLLHSVILQVELYNLYRQSSQRQPVESSAPIALLPPSLIVLANLLEVGSLLWYFFGNIWLFNANMCYKPLFVLSAVWVAWGYLVIGFPLLLCFLLIFCLPCMLWLSNFIGARSWLLSHLNPTLLGNPTGRNVNGNGSSASGLKKQEIDSLPCFVYGDVKNEASNDTGHNHSFEPEDANCCICLNDYVAGQTVVKILPVCSHHFDSECLDRWLALHGTCPLCVQRVFPSESTDDDASSASSVEYYLQNTL